MVNTWGVSDLGDNFPGDNYSQANIPIEKCLNGTSLCQEMSGEKYLGGTKERVSVQRVIVRSPINFSPQTVHPINET